MSHFIGKRAEITNSIEAVGNISDKPSKRDVVRPRNALFDCRERPTAGFSHREPERCRAVLGNWHIYGSYVKVLVHSGDDHCGM